MPHARLCCLSALVLGLSVLLPSCSGGGGGGGSDGGGGGGGAAGTFGDSSIQTSMTVSATGGYARVDLLDGGLPPEDPGATATDAAKRDFLKTLFTIKKNKVTGKWESSGLDLDGSANGDLETYAVGLNPQGATRIIAANNLYDMLQTTTGQPNLSVLFPGFSGYAGGDVGSVDQGIFTGTPDGVDDGGPGLFSNVTGSSVPKLPVLPNGMGIPAWRGPSANDEHQFIQIEFPYDLDVNSLFGSVVGSHGPTSFLPPLVMSIEARAVMSDANGNPVDQTAFHRHVGGVAIIGGVDKFGNPAAITAIPDTLGGFNSVNGRATVSLTGSNIPAGARAKLTQRNVLTYIAHENVQLFVSGDPARGTINGGVLVLPDPTDSGGLGGRVFGATQAVPGAVNDYGITGDSDAAAIGFVVFKISQLRKSSGALVKNPYFHSFTVGQDNVSNGSTLTDPRSVVGPGALPTFNRGPAIEIGQDNLPSIDVLDPVQDIVGGFGAYNPTPSSDDPALGGNVISTRARFLVQFDREVIPNSVGFSRRYTLHSVAGMGVVFPFGGNVRPVRSPASQLSQGSLGAPLAPSIYLALNQEAGINRAPNTATLGKVLKVNSPIFQGVGGTFDDGSTIPPGMNGLNPTNHNTLAQLPRGVVPCDIYPLNQNNLQAYVVEPLVELPPGSIVTLGVCVAGLGYTNAANSISVTNHGNQTRSGTMFTSFQGLTPVGLADATLPLKQTVLPDQAIVKVNAGPMDLQGNLFFGGTAVPIDVLLNGGPSDDTTTGGFNVCRTFKVGDDNLKRYVNAPVSPQAMYLGFSSNNGLGVLDLAGYGFNTNKPGGSAENVGLENYLLTSRFLPPALLGTSGSDFNFNSAGSLAAGNHLEAFGLLSPYTAGTGKSSQGASLQTDYAIGKAIGVGQNTPAPGINEGSSGFETLVRDSAGSELPTLDQGWLVRDIAVGDFLDTLIFDSENPWAAASGHRTHNAPLQGSIFSNTIADPPLPNPPPLRFPVGLPHLAVIFDQDDLSKPPVTVEGCEVFSADGFMTFNDGTGIVAFPRETNSLVQLNPTINASNGSSADAAPLPLAGYLSPFSLLGGMSSPNKFVQTGPMPKSITAGAWVLTLANAITPNFGTSSSLLPPIYQSRQQIGNFLFVTDGINEKLYAVNSNTLDVVRSLSLPDPFGLALSSDLETLFVTNQEDDSVSVVDADPRSAAFMTELKRVPVGAGPRGVVVAPDNEDAFVLNWLGNTISILAVNSQQVRKTLSSQTIDKPFDMCLGMRETIAANMPGFQSGTYHGFISNSGGDNVLVYESGPSGVAGIGFDNIVTTVRPNEGESVRDVGSWLNMKEPRGIVYDPAHPLDTANGTPGCFVAHTDADDGRAVVTRIGYTKDSQPGSQTFNTTVGVPDEKVFEVTAQYRSNFTGKGLDVALPDYNRNRFETESFASFYNLLNAAALPKIFSGGLVMPRNSKYPVGDVIVPAAVNGPRWEPDRLYLSSRNGAAGRIEVFEIANSAHLKTIDTPKPVEVLTSYFAQ